MLLAFQDGGSGWRKSPTAGSRLHDGRNMGLGPLGEKRRVVARLLTAGTAVQDFLTPRLRKIAPAGSQRTGQGIPEPGERSRVDPAGDADPAEFE